jgi:hypothetical protein
LKLKQWGAPLVQEVPGERKLVISDDDDGGGGDNSNNNNVNDNNSMNFSANDAFSCV